MPYKSGTSRVRRRSARSLSLLCVALTLILSGCGLLDGQNATTEPSTRHGILRIGILATVDNAPVKIAETKGFFREQGLDVQVKVLQSGPVALDEVIGGSLDVCLINDVSFFRAVKNTGLDARFIADAYQSTPDSLVLMTRPGSGIREPKDLLGKKVSVHTLGNIVEQLLRALLEGNGLDPDSPTYLDIPFPLIQAALEKGEIDAGVLVEPYITRAANEIGAEPVFRLATSATGTADMPLSGYVALTPFIRDNPGKIAAFQHGIRKANDLANKDRGALAEVLPDLAGAADVNISQLHLGHYPTTLEASRLQRVIDLMEKFGKLPPGLKAADLIVAMPAE